MHASAWIEEGASDQDIGAVMQQFGADNLEQFEGSWQTLTLTERWNHSHIILDSA